MAAGKVHEKLDEIMHEISVMQIGIVRIETKVESIEAQTTKTNGRVTSHDRSLSIINGWKVGIVVAWTILFSIISVAAYKVFEGYGDIEKLVYIHHNELNKDIIMPNADMQKNKEPFPK